MSHQLARRFASEDSGAIAIVFALTLFIVTIMAGGAVDYGRWLHAKSAQQAAIDAAVLAAARTLQISGGDSTQAIDTGKSYYANMKSNLTKTDAVSFQVTENGSVVRGTTTAQVATPFLSLAHIQQLPISTSARVALQQAGVAGTNLEISIMIDLSSGMSGQKMTDLKTATEEFIDIAVWKDQSRFTSKVALVPFAERVNVGTYAEAVTGLPAISNGDGNGGNGTGKGGTNKFLIPCVTERHNTHELDDEGPGNGSYVGAYDANSGTHSYSTNGNCNNPTAELMPLTNDRTALVNRIKSLRTETGSAGQLATAWSWYTLSPNWNTVWPTESQPAPYSHLKERNSNGLPKLRKVAILVVGGSYDTYKGKNQSASRVSENAIAICNNMKAKGIEVFTISMDLATGPTRQAMQHCATSGSYAYDVATGDGLRGAMRDIVLKVSPARLTM